MSASILFGVVIKIILASILFGIVIKILLTQKMGKAERNL